MSIDFVQLRWQQIRQTEAMQLLESENVALRREIQELKNIKPVVVQAVDPNAGSDKKLIKKFAINMKTIMMRTQSELMKLKLVSVQEINIMMNQRNQLSTAFDNLFTAYRVKEAEYEALEAERDDLQEKLDFAQQSLEEGANHQTAELNKMKAKYKQARADLKDAQAEQERLNDALKSLNEKYNSLRSAKVEADANYEGLNKEYLAMQALLDKARADGEAALAESFNNKLVMQEQYEKIIEELSYENEYLRNTCAEQESQIERLTNSLIGNKSHFARYVEVKTENLTLQSKLQAVTKGSSKFGSNSTKTPAGATATSDFAQTGGLPAHSRRAGKGIFASAGAAAVANSGNAHVTLADMHGGGYNAQGERILVPGGAQQQPQHGQQVQQPQTQAQDRQQVSSSGQIQINNAFPPGGMKSVPQTSPRNNFAASRRQGSSNSLSSTLNEPAVLPPPVIVPQPFLLQPDGDSARSSGGAGFGPYEGSGGPSSKKSIRFDPPAAAAFNGPLSTKISRTVV